MRTPHPVTGTPVRALGLVAAALLALAACGDAGSDAPEDGGTTDTSATHGPSSQEAPSAGTPAEETASDDADPSEEAPTEAEAPSEEAPSEDGGSDAAGGEAREPLPPELEPFDQGETVAGMDELRPGDCLDSTGPDPMEPLDCTEEHDTEVYYTFNVEGGEYPGFEELTEPARLECDAQIESYLGGPYVEGDTYLSLYHPTGTTWAAGDTEIVCVLIHWDMQTTSAFGNGGITE